MDATEKKFKILIIDNDRDTLEVMRLVLAEKYEVIASLEVSILHDLEEIKPDMIILDNLLNGTTGCTICKTLKSEAQTAHIPVYLISALPALDYLAIEAGANGYIEKPFDIDELEKFIDLELQKV